jgi:3-phenylpropionate/trans-cinnamate dioxygenase ferredoxin subunit/naphthalene 1,2-dioxygenase system ferredoxin subunit
MSAAGQPGGGDASAADPTGGGDAAPGRRWVTIPIALPPEGETDTFAVDGLELLLCHAEGRAYVVKDECPHVRTSMKGGLIRGTILECPLHGGLMDLRDGSPAGMPIRRAGTCYRVRADGEGWAVEVPA